VFVAIFDAPLLGETSLGRCFDPPILPTGYFFYSGVFLPDDVPIMYIMVRCSVKKTYWLIGTVGQWANVVV